MGGTATFDTLLRYWVIVIPVAVLATLVFLLARRRRGAVPHERESLGERPVEKAAEMPEPLVGPAPVQPATDLRGIEARIDAALSTGDKPALAPLYLDLARAHADFGNDAARMMALRSAAGYGSLHGPRAAHAAARLELAEAAYAAGDLTSACEQWQLARTAFLEDGQTELHARVEKRMRDNGCPTDWVLTDF